MNTTLFGFGERTGNPPLEGAIIEYIALKGDLCGIQTEVITELADYMRSIGLPIPDNYPFVGRDFNTTRAGIHAGGLRQDERIYNIFDTATLLNRPPRVSLTDKTGADGVALWVNEFFGLQGRGPDQQDQVPQGRPLGHGPVRGPRPHDDDQRRGAGAARSTS